MQNQCFKIFINNHVVIEETDNVKIERNEIIHVTHVHIDCHAM